MPEQPPFHPIKTVYSYLPFGVRALIDDLVEPYPHDVFRKSVSGGLDDIHEPIIEKLAIRWDSVLRGLHRFPHRYFTAGSEEGIREFLSYLALTGAEEINVLAGDYEGYEAVATTRGIVTHTWPVGHLARNIPRGWWFVSQPSARDGNILPDGTLTDICNAGHKVFLDLSYLGTTDESRFHVDHPNIKAVALSFSKPFGLFYYRIGFLFSRVPLQSLEANRWFKNVFSLLVAERVIDRLGPQWPALQFKHAQRKIVDYVAAKTGIPLHASDTFLLAHMSAAEADALDTQRRLITMPFRRADSYRFCLTPYFMEREDGTAPLEML